jgi:hypothetical protein
MMVYNGASTAACTNNCARPRGFELVLKNLASRGRYRREDLAPVYVVLGVDAFHALLLSCAMQSSISSGTLITIMGTDIFQSIVAVVKVRLTIEKLVRHEFQ